MLVCRENLVLKFMFSEKATKIDEIFIIDMTLCSKGQIDGKDFFNFRSLLRKYELYKMCGLAKKTGGQLTFSTLKFIYSEKAINFCEISTVDLSYALTVKSTVEILKIFVAFSFYM